MDYLNHKSFDYGNAPGVLYRFYTYGEWLSLIYWLFESDQIERLDYNEKSKEENYRDIGLLANSTGFGLTNRIIFDKTGRSCLLIMNDEEM